MIDYSHLPEYLEPTREPVWARNLINWIELIRELVIDAVEVRIEETVIIRLNVDTEPEGAEWSGVFPRLVRGEKEGMPFQAQYESHWPLKGGEMLVCYSVKLT